LRCLTCDSLRIFIQTFEHELIVHGEKEPSAGR